ncbi:Uncharacterized conserved protein YbjT, contains NAD(P)-binding and DUF2867 domains [Flavobacteriaceae bacterium MAR_2010_188]|nr:Uncharacterized conserved protein YbjT, contains NAD(P)-binding and DUF2867 domains [Flavobacteriaceae bacterium MAR_2010_188]
MGKSAIVLGATGLTGGLLLNKLLENEVYDSVLVFGRNSCGINHPKLKETLVDLFALENYKDQFKADIVFCCIGTTKSKTPDKKTYQKIDKGIPVKAANISKANGINTFMVMSSMGADENSRIFYNRTKGEMEKEVINAKVNKTYILRPSLIKGDREKTRLGEKIGGAVMDLLSPIMIGDLKKYRPITAKQIVDCMLYLAKHQYEKQIIISDEIMEIAAKE